MSQISLLRKLGKCKSWRLLIYSIGKFFSKKRLLENIGHLKPFNKIPLIKKKQEYSCLFSQFDYGLWHGNVIFLDFFHVKDPPNPKTKQMTVLQRTDKLPTVDFSPERLRCSCFRSIACTIYNLSALPTTWGMKNFCNHKLVNSIMLMDILSSRLLKH